MHDYDSQDYEEHEGEQVSLLVVFMALTILALNDLRDRLCKKAK
jgi:hypothetical protein